jgi:hypothetical protein
MNNNVGCRWRLIPGNNLLRYFSMRKRLAAAAIAAISASGILLAPAPAALADVSSCSTDLYGSYCEDLVNTAAGSAGTQSFGGGGQFDASFWNDSGYNMRVWIAVDYGNGPVIIWWTPMASNQYPNGLESPVFNTAGATAYACFQFTSWSGAANHCTAGQ